MSSGARDSGEFGVENEGENLRESRHTAGDYTRALASAESAEWQTTGEYGLTRRN